MEVATEFELEIQREQLLKPLQLIVAAIDKKQTLPILSSILFSIDKNQLKLTGTDLEIELVKTISLVGNDAKTQLAVPAKKLNDICRALPNDSQIRFIRQKNQLVIRSGRSRFTLSLMAAADFPTLEKSNQPLFSFAMKAVAMKTLLEKTAFSMAQQDVRYFLNGLLLDLQGSVVTAVTTDGHRLSSSMQLVDFKADERQDVLVPRKAAMELIKLLEADSEELVEVQVGENYISVISDDFTFTSKLIDGKFPEYRPLFPKAAKNTVSIDKHVLRDALSRVAILSNEKYRGAWLNFEEGRLLLQANNPDKDEAEEELALDYSGEKIRIGCNINYILDVLAVIDGDTVLFHLTDANSSLLIEALDSSDSQYVVMPMCL